MAQSLEGEIGALLDAGTDPDDIEEDRCGARGPHGDECCRDRGHREDAWAQNLHVSYDSDRYRSWPVGWRSLSERITAVLDPAFGQQVTGSPEYLAGFRDCHQLVAQLLRPKTK